MNDSAINYQQLLTETLQKQMVILGPTITLTKARHVDGLHVADDGKVTGIEGNPQQISIQLLEQFRELSPLMVKKTMKPLLDTIISSYPKAPDQKTEHTEPEKHEETTKQEEQAADQSEQHEDQKDHHEENQKKPSEPVQHVG